jgi:hypothetical protein
LRSVPIIFVALNVNVSLVEILGGGRSITLSRGLFWSFAVGWGVGGPPAAQPPSLEIPTQESIPENAQMNAIPKIGITVRSPKSMHVQII